MPFNRQQNHMLFGFSLWAHFCWRNFSGILGGKSDLIGRPMGKSLPTTGNQPCSFTIGSYRNEDLPLTFLWTNEPCFQGPFQEENSLPTIIFWGSKRKDFKLGHHSSGQIIATSHDRFPPNGGLVMEFPLFQGNLGWWNIIIWPDSLKCSNVFNMWFCFTGPRVLRAICCFQRSYNFFYAKKITGKTGVFMDWYSTYPEVDV